MCGFLLHNWSAHDRPSFWGPHLFPSHDQNYYNYVEDPGNSRIEREQPLVAAGVLAEEGKLRRLGLDLRGEF